MNRTVRLINHALVGADYETIELVSGILEDCSYKRLKNQLIKRLPVSETVKLNHLLTELRLGDRALRETQLGGDKVGTELLHSLWL